MTEKSEAEKAAEKRAAALDDRESRAEDSDRNGFVVRGSD